MVYWIELRCEAAQRCCWHEELRTCQQVFCSSEVGYDKPAAEFFHEIERRLGVGSEHFIMVGDDRELDASAAERAGWIGLWLNRNPALKLNDLDAPPGWQRSRSSSPGCFELFCFSWGAFDCAGDCSTWLFQERDRLQFDLFDRLEVIECRFCFIAADLSMEV